MLILQYKQGTGLVTNLSRISRWPRSQREAITSITVDGDNNIYALHADADKRITKYDSSLDAVKSVTFAGFASAALEKEGDVVYLASSDTVFLGCRESTPTGPMIMELSKDLTTVVSSQNYGDGNGSVNAMVEDLNGNLALIGHTTANDGFIKVVDPTDLSVVTDYKWGGGGIEAFYDMVVDHTNNFYYVVGTTTQDTAGGYDTLIMKLDSTYTVVESVVVGTNESERYNTSVDVDSSGNVFFTGFHTSPYTGYFGRVAADFNSVVVKEIVTDDSGGYEMYATKVVSDGVIFAGAIQDDGFTTNGLPVLIKYDNTLTTKSDDILLTGGASSMGWASLKDFNGQIIAGGWTAWSDGSNYDNCPTLMAFDKDFTGMDNGSITSLPNYAFSTSTYTIATKSSALADVTLTRTANSTTLTATNFTGPTNDAAVSEIESGDY